MANVKNIEVKAAKVAEIKEKMEKAKCVVVFDYRGLTVAEVTDLRNQMRKEGVEYVVLKNHSVYRASEMMSLSGDLSPILHGPSAFAFGYDDVTAAARILKNFVKSAKKCEIKGGIVENTVMNSKQMDAIAELPSREVLLSRLVGSLLSPIRSLAVAINQIAQAKAEQEA
ncbi:MAG TPA: 50S ribosomal protein L10 [Clostridia bacterium]|nr:50S ribosomal protein L10 [Clostridia bacterium]